LEASPAWNITSYAHLVRNRTRRLPLAQMANVIFIRSRRGVLIGRFGKTLRDAIKEILEQPLPEQWIDLIKRLNAKEKEEER
jgi:hypothetical protein